MQSAARRQQSVAVAAMQAKVAIVRQGDAAGRDALEDIRRQKQQFVSRQKVLDQVRPRRQ